MKYTGILQFYPTSSIVGGAAKSNLLVSELMTNKNLDVYAIIPYTKEKNDISQKLLAKKIQFKKMIIPASIAPEEFKNQKEKYSFYFKLLIKFIFFVPNEIRILLWLIKHKEYIVYHGGANIIQGYFAARILHRPYFVHAREYVQEDQHWKYLFPKHQVNYYNNCKRLICVSKDLANTFKRKYPKANITTIYNAVFSQNEQQSIKQHVFSKEHINLLMVGSISQHKGQKQAIEALGVLKEKGIAFKINLTIVGEASADEQEYLNTLKQTIKKYKLESSVIFTGYQSNIQHYYNNSDIVLVCSTREAFGRSTIEAANYGCIVIGANTGATPELINIIGGETYEYDNKFDLANKIEDVCRHQNEYKKESIIAQEKVRTFFNTEKLQKEIYQVLMN